MESLRLRILIVDDMPPGVFEIAYVRPNGKPAIMTIENLQVEDAQGGDPNPEQPEG